MKQKSFPEIFKNLRLCLPLLLFFIFSCILPCRQTVAAPAAALKPSKVLICNEAVFDAGVVKLGQNYQVLHRFQFKNIGDEDVTIKRIEASCTCANAIAEKALIKKGESSFIDVTVNVSPADYEGVKAKLLVETSHGLLELQFNATPEFEPYIQPDKLYFWSPQFGRKARQKFHIIMPSYQKTENFLESIRNESKHLSIRVIDQQCQRRTDQKNNPYFLYIANVEATLDLTSEKDDGQTTLSILLANKRELKFDVKWMAPEKEIFLPCTYLLSKESKEPIEMQVMYNSLFGGTAMDIKLVGEGIKIKRKRESPPYHIFDLECDSLTSVLRGKTALIIKTQSGEEHTLPFVVTD
jgi:hypothetical protein